MSAKGADRRKAFHEILYNNEKRSGSSQLLHMQAHNAFFYDGRSYRSHVAADKQRREQLPCAVGNAYNNDGYADIGIWWQKQLTAHKKLLKVELFVYSAKNCESLQKRLDLL